MRSDLKVGIVLGVVIVATAILLFVGRGGCPGLDEPVSPVTDDVEKQLVDDIPESGIVRPLDETQPGLIVVKPRIPKVSEPVVSAVPEDPCLPASTEPADPDITDAPVPQQEPKISLEPHVDVDSAEPEVIYHTVAKGDSLYEIAESHYGHGRHWKVIYDANRQIIGADSNKLRTGLKLRIPSPDLVAGP